MRVTVRLFARLRDIAGSGELSRDVPAGATVADVWRGLVAEFPRWRATIVDFVGGERDYAKMTARSRTGTRSRSCRRCPAGLKTLWIEGSGF